MSSIQERLQMKRVPLDTWSTQEKLCLASSVVRSGDQNWMSVSRALRLLGDPNRPADWFSQKNCAAQYGSLLENVETPRRKKRAGEGATETPQESIVKKLTQQRIQELQKEMADTAKAFAKFKEEVKELSSDNITESRVRELNVALDVMWRERERGALRRAQWLREREQRRARLERAWRRPEGAAAPLLTSLLQSPAHHSLDGTPLGGSPTLSLLLEKTTNSIAVTSTEPPMLQPISDHKVVSKSELQKLEQLKFELQEIEQIKSELQEIEHQYRGANPPSSDVLSNIPQIQNGPPPELMPTKDPPPTEKTPEKIEIDDIEIKAEDVYAFSDIDLDIPPVSSIHKSSLTRTLHSDKNLFNKRENPSSVQNLDEVASPSGGDSTDVLNSLLSPINVNENSNTDSASCGNIINPPAAETETIERIIEDNITDKPAKDKPDSKDADPSESNLEISQAIKLEVETETLSETNAREEEDSSDGEMNQKVADIKKELESKQSNEDLRETSENVDMEVEETPKEQSLHEMNKMESEMMETQTMETKESETTPLDQPMETHTETDDDTPIEVIKEDKPGKTKRDYSRKKTEKDEATGSPGETEGIVSNKSEYSDEIGSDNSQGSTDKKSLSRRFRNEVSGSESPATPLDSLPGSPAPGTPPPAPVASPAPEPDKEYRTWKKAIHLAYSRLNTLKYASLFLRPITDDQAPGYSQVVKRPMDLSTIRRNVDTGVIRTTKEFRREVLLMMNNALMYNKSDHRVYAMTRETLTDVHIQLNILLQAQGHAPLGTPPSRQVRPLHSLTRSAPPPPRRKRGGETPTPI